MAQQRMSPGKPDLRLLRDRFYCSKCGAAQLRTQDEHPISKFRRQHLSPKKRDEEWKGITCTNCGHVNYVVEKPRMPLIDVNNE